MNYVMQPYDDALNLILEKGVRKSNRTGVDTIGVFGIQSRYRLSERFPILTGRKMPWRAGFAELLWFLSGSTSNQDLVELGCNFWTPWVSAEFEEQHGYGADEFGPIYGFQLRHFGADFELDSSGGVDQLAVMIKTLKEDPFSRRNLFSLWHPGQLHLMRLPPCHYSFQVFVEQRGLSGLLTQRSCDFPIGVPFNIQFYSGLIVMLAAECNMIPWELVHSTADSHIYVNQIEAVQEYLARPKPASPILEYTKVPDILSSRPQRSWLDCFKLVGYNPQPSIKIPVAI